MSIKSPIICVRCSGSASRTLRGGIKCGAWGTHGGQLRYREDFRAPFAHAGAYGPTLHVGLTSSVVRITPDTTRCPCASVPRKGRGIEVSGAPMTRPRTRVHRHLKKAGKAVPQGRTRPPAQSIPSTRVTTGVYAAGIEEGGHPLTTRHTMVLPAHRGNGEIPW
jgi:hypothetical protein